MMSDIFKLFITETLQKECEIEAENEEQAFQMLEKMYHKGEIALDYSDLVDTEFGNCTYSIKKMIIEKEQDQWK